jgi:hypothetical protein
MLFRRKCAFRPTYVTMMGAPAPPASPVSEGLDRKIVSMVRFERIEIPWQIIYEPDLVFRRHILLPSYDRRAPGSGSLFPPPPSRAPSLLGCQGSDVTAR